jgi:hypothetical protein
VLLDGGGGATGSALSDMVCGRGVE